MDYLPSLIFPLVFAVVVVLISMTHLHWRKSAPWLLVSSLLLFMLTFVGVLGCGRHYCDQGMAPMYLCEVASGLVVIMPWLGWFSLRTRRVLVLLVVFSGSAISSILVASYHGDVVTGNPRYANGRFWHTALTGQYPRGIKPEECQRLEAERRMKEAEEMQLLEADPTSEPGDEH